MIAHLTGKVLSRRGGQLVIDVAGVGYLVSVTPEVYQKSFTESNLALHIAHIIREDAQLLFGFSSEEELETFNMLCSVNGVGPKSAMTVLGHLGVGGVAQAVATVDDSMFRSVSGIGPKTAKLIVLTLTGKLIAGEGSSSSLKESEHSVVAALVGLGYQDKLAKQAVSVIVKDARNLGESELLKLTLAHLAAGRKQS